LKVVNRVAIELLSIAVLPGCGRWFCCQWQGQQGDHQQRTWPKQEQHTLQTGR